MGKKGYLILENGQIFEGDSLGSERYIEGEAVFSTGMTGYPESFTDPSYYGQILTMTYPLIGNYGVPARRKKLQLLAHFESEKIQIRGLVMSSYVQNASHWQSSESLSSWLKKENIPALSGIDTRTLTKILREKGVMNAIMTFEKPRNLSGFTFYDINRDNLVSYVSTKEKTVYGNGKLKILFYDCGLKLNQIRIFLRYDTTIIRVPWNFDPLKEETDFDAVFVSNGPGDARTMPETIRSLKEILKRKIPTFGICLGQQLLALAAGGDIYKLKYGHRGQNQPVKDIVSGKCYITSHNHGYSVVERSLPSDWNIWFINLNDNTNEGIRHEKFPFFAVQFHPEANPGPTDTEWLFHYFVNEAKRWLKIT
ncbi:glutamine-hydrolyzing carbamoyl-phosphate synthase small subunit [Candidatus Gottesmanbacteria bacterium]|nr:glutamine-hydrolyzing carbamoyl-phosphate synthase small subunit [Candidatus Gottesmanbacteria bacterium]